jgi:hypothetical protein
MNIGNNMCICYCCYTCWIFRVWGAGIVAGLLASIVQSICYGEYIAAGGLFSILQSVGSLGLKVFLTRPGMIFLGISIAVGIIYNIIISIF